MNCSVVYNTIFNKNIKSLLNAIDVEPTDTTCRTYLEIKRFIAVEDENKAAELIAKRFH